MKRIILASFAAAALVFLVTKRAEAAPPFVDRNITLPRHDWAFDLGLGIAHDDRFRGPTGPGMSFEMGVGVTDRFEIGARTGLRMTDDARALQADTYGRLFDRQTFGVGTDVMANPELRFRGALAKHDVAEVALEGRAYLPFEARTKPGFLFGVPLMFHIGHSVRLDTGVFLPVVFYENTEYHVSVPFDVWIQVTHKLWLGPMAGVRFNHYAPNIDNTDVQLGFGLGYQITRIVDFKTMFYIPRLNDDNGVHRFGVGAGVQIRIE